MAEGPGCRVRGRHADTGQRFREEKPVWPDKVSVGSVGSGGGRK